jgi:hypothetical protein
MWRLLAFAVVAICLQAACLVSRAQAQLAIDCASFMKNPDGSWTVISKAYIPGPNVRVEEGSVFRRGGTFLGEDLAERLDRACPNVPITTPTAQPTSPQVPLSTYADANGNIDVRRLTCAYLDNASTEETGLLLSWYSGSYNAVAKKRGFNLERVRSGIRNVVDYCKANPDKNLAQALDLILK